MSFPTSPTDGQTYNGYIYNNTIGVWKKDVASKDEMFPIGMLYTQYPGESSPDNLGWPGTWTNISSNFSGDFFRVEGGDASTFGSGEQSDAIRNISGYFGSADMGMNSSYGDGPFVSGQYSFIGLNSETDNSDEGSEDNGWLFDASRVVPTANENRPKNRTIRIWKRTA